MHKTIIKLLILLAVFSIDANTSAMAKDEIEADIRFLYVQPGQTLHNIVRRLYPERPREWQKLEQQIVDAIPMRSSMAM